MKCQFFNNIKKPSYILIIILIKWQMDKTTFRILVVCSSCTHNTFEKLLHSARLRLSSLVYGILTWHFEKMMGWLLRPSVISKYPTSNPKCQSIHVTSDHIKSQPRLWAALHPPCCLNIQMGWSSPSLWDSHCLLPVGCGRICAHPSHPWHHHLRP